jgi:hypothetical protein
VSLDSIPLKRRLLVIGGYIAATFVIGSLIFYLFAEGEIRKYYLWSIALFPGGLVILGLGNASVPVGWAAYGLCLLALIGFARRNAFLITCSIFTVLILVNLFGCAVSL